MESIDVIDATGNAYSWRGIFITLTLATSVLFFFLRQRTSLLGTPTSPSASLSEEERRKRREHLAAIAEERAKAERLEESSGEIITSDGIEKGVIKDKKSIPVKKQSDERAGKPRVNDPPNDDIQTSNANKNREETIDNSTNANSIDFVDDKPETEEKEEKESVVDADADADVLGEAGKESTNNNGDVDDDDDIDPGVNPDSNVSIGEADNTRHTINDQEEFTNGDEADFQSASDKGKSAEGDTGHRERHAKAIAKIMAKKGKQDEKTKKGKQDEQTKKGKQDEKTKKGKQDERSPAVHSLTIHLILTSSPGSPRIQLSIPTTVTAALLLSCVSKASGVSEGELKLIFRGRIITKLCNTERVVDEFKIENGSVLHVMGKPQQREDNGDDAGSEEFNSNSGEEESIDSGGNDSQDEAVRFSTTRARALIMADIRRSSGQDYYHRAAHRGDLDILREAVDAGLSEYLHVADSNGWTPLHEAIRAGHADVVEYLVQEVGLDINAVTNQGAGWSPISLALEQHGANHPVTIMVQTLMHQTHQTDPPANPWGNLQEER